MKVLFYRYGNICEPDILSAFCEIGLDAEEITAEITNKKLSASKRVELVSNAIEAGRPLFVFSINFFPAIAEVCHIYRLPYVCWSVDCPVLELFSSAILYDTNRIFLFDRAQYAYFSRYNPDCIFYLPLAAAVSRFDKVISTITPQERKKFACELSFVGSLYSEKNRLTSVRLDDYTRGYLQGLTEASLQVYGCNFIEDAMNESLVAAIKSAVPDFYQAADAVTNPDRHVAAHSYVGIAVSEQERIRTLNTLAAHFPVALYTGSDTTPLHNVTVHGRIQSLTEMPKVFHLSKINLNMTIKPIQTGLPLRIFDICGCGGFVMTNYQAELPEYFEIGTDIEAYGSMDELIEKCDFYLSHEDSRRKIAQNGYEKVKQAHTYRLRLPSMLKTAFHSLSS